MTALRVVPSGFNTTPNPDKYIDKREGLLVATLADDILAEGPLAEGIDDIVWGYAGGVWVPDKHVVRTRAARLLGERYRDSHARNAESVVRSRGRRIDCSPVGHVVNFRNGLLHWQTGRLLDHTPEVLSTVQMSCDWAPDAACPEFDTFLAQVVKPDMIDLIWELIGYLMYSGNPLHRAVMLVGGGRNGKGTFLRVINRLLGESNVSAVSLNDLVGTRFSVASLFGKIANVAGDIDGTFLESTAMFKALTGQDLVSAEYKGRDRFEFTPWAVPVFSANKIPGSADTTNGYMSRWLVIEFPNDFTGREDRTLDSRLNTQAELSGIAVKAMPALVRLLERGGFDLPESAVAAKEEFERRVDQVRTWVSECTQMDPDLPHINRTVLYTAYKSWAARDGYRAVKASEFYDRLESAGAVPKKIDGTRGFTGIRITDHVGE
jgi:putative DNA primase/helicase